MARGDAESIEGLAGDGLGEGDVRAVSVVVDVAARAVDRAFSYAVPDDLADACQVGCAVAVGFGGRTAVGYVIATDADPACEPARLKPILAVLGGPYFSEQAAQLALWVAREYVSPLSDAIRLLTPPGPAPRAVRRVGPDGSVRWEVEDRRVAPAEERWASLTDAGRAIELPKNATRQREVCSALAAGPAPVRELAAACGGAVSSALAALERKGAVTIESRRRIRGDEPLPPATGEDLPLTAGQTEALGAIDDALASRSGGVVVLDGVTGSGKTEVYLRAVRHVLDQGGSAIVLVPEISLTPQTVGRFRSRLGRSVAVLHSRLSVGERRDQWDLLASGAARVAVGARSALFAPVRDVRLVVIDEEHEPTYKQESSPRYHARDVAAHMARQLGCALVLGSATPSVETLSRCEAGEWQLVSLPERASGRPLPPVEVVDLGSEFSRGNRSMFSGPLARALIDAMSRGEKAVMLYNRRGFARFLLCRECGFVPRCDECSVSLTYHEGREGPFLMCHNCGRAYPVPPRCPSCGSPYLKRMGKGTEQVELALRELLVDGMGDEGADVPIVRMDADTVRAKGAHAHLLSQFAEAERGILLGTQMIAKGLDFPDVTLAAVLNADTSLNLPDFRSGERTYQLVEQVAGRAGRDRLPGRVIVQTYWPDHPAIRAAAAHDRSIFLGPELAQRRELGYPPFSRLANLRVWGKDARQVRQAASELAQRLAERLGQERLSQGYEILGPTPCLIERSRNAWQWHVLLRGPAGSDLPAIAGETLRGWRSPAGVSCAADIDPQSLL